MANQWLRLWHDMPNDPKWRTISRVSGQRISDVIAVYVHVLVNASNATERGRTQGLCTEDLASALDIESAQVESILDAMQGRVLEGDEVAGWEKRQPAREDGASERAKAWREAQKAEKERNRTQPNATERPDTDTDTDKRKEAKASLSADAATQPCPHQEIIELYHANLPANPRIKVWDGTRSEALRTRWREDIKRQSLDYWARFFRHCAASKFLTGQVEDRNGRPFTPGLDWLVKASNFAKIIEGRYHDKAAQ